MMTVWWKMSDPISIPDRTELKLRPITLNEILKEGGEIDLATKLFGPRLTRAQAKQRKLRHKTTSKYKGVFPDRFRWRAVITCNYRKIALGTYDMEEEAARAYNEAAKKIHGDLACLNVLPTGV